MNMRQLPAPAGKHVTVAADAGRPTYDGLKQKVQEKDAQLDEALAIIKELTDALQGVRVSSA